MSQLAPDIKARLDAAEKAVAHAIRRIRQEPAIYWHCGEGTELYSLLVASWALTSGYPEWEVKENARPDPASLEALEQERQRCHRVMEHLDDQLKFEKGGESADGEDLLTIPVRKLRPAADGE